MNCGTFLSACLTLTLGLLLIGCGSRDDYRTIPAEQRSATAADIIPGPISEFRAAWVATVINIDWPSSNSLSAKKQQAEAIAILDRLVELNFNAVILQVRPQADAIYHSKIEPWSYYLTGEQGKKPKPSWDPLTFWVQEAHSRGLLLHAWFNPFRANHKGHKGGLSKKSIVKDQPELVHRLGDEGYWWMDPAQEAAQAHTRRVVKDVIDRYDIDGVHFDDYFYPYPSYHKNQDFPDDATYAEYQKSGGKLDRADWRRDSVNRFVKALYDDVRGSGKNIEFGISPFGIWRPNHPPGIAGMDQYEVLYADAKLWLNEGWVDYFMPQLYWPIDSKGQSFTALLDWWSEENTKQRHMWPGLTIVKAKDADGASEIVNQINYTRRTQGSGSGVCLFSMKWLQHSDYQIATQLGTGPFAEKALPPPSPWIDSEPLPRPHVDLLADYEDSRIVRFHIKEKTDEPLYQYLVNERKNGKWLSPKLVAPRFSSYPVESDVQEIAVRSVDRMRNISEPTIIKVNAELAK